MHLSACAAIIALTLSLPALGDGYRAGGRKAEAKAAYEHALKLAPDNWNAAYQRRMIRELGAGTE